MSLALSPKERKALRAYWGRLDAGARACRLQRQHWVPDISEYGDNPEITIEYNRSKGYYEVVAYCHRCHARVTYDVDRNSGFIVDGSRHMKLSPGYAFTEEDGGDGTPMDARKRAYLRSFAVEDAVAIRRSRPVPFRSTRSAS